MDSKLKNTHNYDKKAGVLYITFGDDEPVYTEDLNGVLMLEIGWFSRLPKGLRIIGPKAHNLKQVQWKIVKQLEKEVKSIIDRRARAIQHEENALQNLLDTELSRAFTSLV